MIECRECIATEASALGSLSVCVSWDGYVSVGGERSAGGGSAGTCYFERRGIGSCAIPALPEVRYESEVATDTELHLFRGGGVCFYKRRCEDPHHCVFAYVVSDWS